MADNEKKDMTPTIANKLIINPTILQIKPETANPLPVSFTSGVIAVVGIVIF